MMNTGNCDQENMCEKPEVEKKEIDRELDLVAVSAKVLSKEVETIYSILIPVLAPATPHGTLCDKMPEQSVGTDMGNKIHDICAEIREQCYKLQEITRRLEI